MVITGNTSGSDPEVIEEVEDTLEMLQISRNFELIENVDGVSASLNEEEICVKTEEEAEYVIKTEYDDINATHDENETNPIDTSDTSVLHQGRSNVEQVYSVRGPVDSDEQNQLDAESELGTMMRFSKNESIKKCGLKKLSRKNSSQHPKGQIDLKDQTSHVAAFGDNDKLKKIKKQNRVMAKLEKKVVETLQCNQCEYCARHPSKLMEHKQAKHTDKTYNCENCQFTSGYLSSFIRHRRAEHEGRTYDCNQCSFKGKDNVWLVIHKQSKHENTFYCCDKCSFITKAQFYLRRHEKKCGKGEKK